MDPPKTTPRRKPRTEASKSKKFSMSFIESDVDVPLSKPIARSTGVLNILDVDGAAPSTPRRSLRVQAKNDLNTTSDFTEFKTPKIKKSKRATIAVATLHGSSEQAPSSKRSEKIKKVKTARNYTSDDQLSDIHLSEEDVNDDNQLNGHDVKNDSPQSEEPVNNGNVKNDEDLSDEKQSKKKRVSRSSLIEAIVDPLANINGVKTGETKLNLTFEKESVELQQNGVGASSADELEPDNGGATSLGYFDAEPVDSGSPNISKKNEKDNNISGVDALTEDEDEDPVPKETPQQITLTEDENEDPVLKVIPHQIARMSVIDLTDSPANKADKELNRTFSPSPRGKRNQMKETDANEKVVQEKRKKVAFQNIELKLESGVKFKKTPRKMPESDGVVLPRAEVEIPSLAEIQNRANEKRKMKNAETLTKMQDGKCQDLATSATKRVKVPDFSQIHNNLFEKMESIDETIHRQAARAKNLMSGKKPVIAGSNTPAKNRVNLEDRLNKSNVLKERSNGHAQIAKPVFGKAQIVKPVFGKAAKEKAEDRLERRKQMFKARPVARNATADIIKGVRSNRRFDLLMKSRQAK